MRLLNAYTLDFLEVVDGNPPPYAVLSHTWGSDEITYKDMAWLQEYRRLYETPTEPPPATNGGSGKGKEVDPASPGAAAPSYAPAGESSAPPPPADADPEKEEECPEYTEAAETSTEEQTTARELRARNGYRKILNAAEHTRASQIGYLWIDTCCVDRSSSADVSEAVLAAHRIFKHSAICFIYLADVPADDAIADRDSVFRRSWWFTRAWTLIELLAPTARVWFDQSWNFIFPDSLLLAEITGIDFTFVEGADYGTVPCVAKRLSWAAHRSATRPEDVAYCLMGLFNIAMPVLYGEGQQSAFLRLQRKILKKTADPSIFAWGYECLILSDGQRTFAVSPDEFGGCRTLRLHPKLEPLNETITAHPRGLNFTTDIGSARSNRATYLFEYFVLFPEILDDRNLQDAIVLPAGTYRDVADISTTAPILYRIPGARPVRISRGSFLRMNHLRARSIYLRSNLYGVVKLPTSQIPTSLDVLFAPSLSTLPFRLVEIFPPTRYSFTSGGFVSFGHSPDASRPVTIFLRFEQSGAFRDAFGPDRRRFVVILQYDPIVSRAKDIAVADLTARVVDCTSAPLLSFIDEFYNSPKRADRALWARFPWEADIGDSRICASFKMNADGRGTPRLSIDARFLEPGETRLVTRLENAFELRQVK